jgi:hypothetical protein
VLKKGFKLNCLQNPERGLEYQCVSIFVINDYNPDYSITPDITGNPKKTLLTVPKIYQKHSMQLSGNESLTVKILYSRDS